MTTHKKAMDVTISKNHDITKVKAYNKELQAHTHYMRDNAEELQQQLVFKRAVFKRPGVAGAVLQTPP